jgi:tetrapyrrole methylase family protein/MazG family protein
MKSRDDLKKLFDIMDRLLAPAGCPWDREQTPQTLAKYVIEESHELVEAIENNDTAGTIEELGDVLFQVVFHCRLAEKQGSFNFEQVVDTVCQKLIRRHPHVFAETKVTGTDEVLKNWDLIKKEEKKSSPKSAVNSEFKFQIPLSLPALQRAQKIGDKTKVLQFDWQDSDEVLLKVDEELGELKEALKEGRDQKSQKNDAHVAEELGDLLFVLAQLARHLKLDAEGVARNANRKFEARFEKLGELASLKNLDYHNLSSAEKEALWEEVKALESK